MPTLKPASTLFWTQALCRLLWMSVRLYRITCSVFLGGHCRFVPSCSRYAEKALLLHTPRQALGLIAGRVLRCQPWGTPYGLSSGHDPVPSPAAENGPTRCK